MKGFFNGMILSEQRVIAQLVYSVIDEDGENSEDLLKFLLNYCLLDDQFYNNFNSLDSNDFVSSAEFKELFFDDCYQGPAPFASDLSRDNEGL
jgi:hypothetical protein